MSKEKEALDLQEEFCPAEEKTVEEVEQEMEAYMLEEHTGKKKKVRKKWSKKKKLITGGGIVLALFLLKVLTGGSKEVLPVAVTAPLTKGDVTSVLTLNGPVSGTVSADVVSNLHAEVLSINVREGDRVEKGQTLAVIDSADVKKAADMAQNSYELAVSEYERSIKDSQSNYEKAVQDYQAAKLNYERNQVLFQAGDIPSVEYESAGNAMRDAKRAVDSFTVEKGRAVPDKSYELKVKSARYDLEQKQKDLENTEVKSPITGTVVRVNSKVGQFADKPEDEKPMFVVEDLDNLEMEIAVSEYSVGKVKIGQKAEIAADIMGGEKAEGQIISISPTGEEKGSSTERVVPTTIRIDGDSKGLIAGITARASIITGEAKGVFKVPQMAIISNPDETLSVAVVEPADSTIRIIPVTMGIEGELEAEILPVEEGALTEGMLIVTAPAGLTDGMKVTYR